MMKSHEEEEAEEEAGEEAEEEAGEEAEEEAGEEAASEPSPEPLAPFNSLVSIQLLIYCYKSAATHQEIWAYNIS